VRSLPTVFTLARFWPHTRASLGAPRIRLQHDARAELRVRRARHRIRERQWCAKLRAWPVNWDRILPPPGFLRRLVVQPGQLPPAPGELCDCCAGYYRIDDIRRFLRELAREAIVLP
jgi:hypothetical protein